MLKVGRSSPIWELNPKQEILFTYFKTVSNILQLNKSKNVYQILKLFRPAFFLPQFFWLEVLGLGP